MTFYPEDDPKLLNPNRLEGHEGYMIRVTKPSITAFIGCTKDFLPYWSLSIVIPNGAIVMLLGTWYNSQVERGWVDVLYNESKVRIFLDLNQWMTYFVPWPHGAFVQVL